jgi:hypothetical protein
MNMMKRSAPYAMVLITSMGIVIIEVARVPDRLEIFRKLAFYPEWSDRDRARVVNGATPSVFGHIFTSLFPQAGERSFGMNPSTVRPSRKK